MWMMVILKQWCILRRAATIRKKKILEGEKVEGLESEQANHFIAWPRSNRGYCFVLKCLITY